MRWAALLAIVILALLGIAGAVVLGAPSGSRASSAPLAAPLGCSVKPACGAGEVAVLRMSSAVNAHAGTAGGSSYGNVVCCGGVHNLSTACSALYDTVVTLSGTDNAHLAADGSYANQVCLSVPHGVADCIYGATCGADYQCLATVSGSSNAHAADCDGVNDYATKVCCYVEDDNDNDGMLDPADADDDNDAFYDSVEGFVGTDPWDACRDNPTDDAWPPDVNMDGVVDITDAGTFLKAFPSAQGNPNYSKRQDMAANDGVIDIIDAGTFLLHFPGTCTP